MKLNIGESIPVKVIARKRWNDSDLEVAAGETYEFTATGEWRDLSIKRDAGGYIKNYMKIFEKWRRSPKDKWFALMGSINHDYDFLIGTGTKQTMNYHGSLSFYANDVKGFYWNNFGEVEVVVKRIA